MKQEKVQEHRIEFNRGVKQGRQEAQKDEIKFLDKFNGGELKTYTEITKRIAELKGKK